MRIEARQIILHRRGGVALRIDRDEIGVDAIGILAHRPQHLGNLEQRGRADVGAMGEAEKDQRRTALQVLLGHGLAGLVGQLKRPADRGRRGHASQSAQRPQHQHQPDHQASGECGDDDQRAGGPIHHEIPLIQIRSRRRCRTRWSRRRPPSRNGTRAPARRTGDDAETGAGHHDRRRGPARRHCARYFLRRGNRLSHARARPK